jgi:hypothetical protein
MTILLNRPIKIANLDNNNIKIINNKIYQIIIINGDRINNNLIFRIKIKQI